MVPDLIVSVDTEYVRRREAEDRGGLPEGAGRRNAVLCYSVAVLVPATGRSFTAIVHTAGPEHRRRLYLGGLLSRIVHALEREGALDPVPRKLSVVLVMHFSRADLCGFRDYPALKRKVDSVRGTYATVQRPLRLDLRLPNGARVPCTVTLRDTLLLAPAGHGALAALGAAVGTGKLKLGKLADGRPAIGHMDRLREEDPALFDAYALRDAEVALAWYLEVRGLMSGQLGLDVPPPTLGSAAVRLFRRQLEAAGHDLHALLGQRVVREGRKKRVEWLPAYDDIRTLAERCYHGGTNYAAVAGFLPPRTGPTSTSRAPTRPAWPRSGCPTGAPSARRESPRRWPTSRRASAWRGSGSASRTARATPACRSAPARAGCVFPLEGESWCTGPELRVALDLGAEVVVERGVIVPWKAGLAAPVRRVLEAHRPAAQGPPEGLAVRAAGQGDGQLALRQARPGGLPGRRREPGRRHHAGAGRGRQAGVRQPPRHARARPAEPDHPGRVRRLRHRAVPGAARRAGGPAAGRRDPGDGDHGRLPGRRRPGARRHQRPGRLLLLPAAGHARRRSGHPRGEAPGAGGRRLPHPGHGRHRRRGQADPGARRSPAGRPDRPRRDAGRDAGGAAARGAVGGGAGLGGPLPEPGTPGRPSTGGT